MTFEEWAEVLFVKKPDALASGGDEVSFPIDGERFLEHCRRLFDSPEFLLEKYPLFNLSAGFSCLYSPGSELPTALGSPDVKTETKIEVLKSMKSLFSKLVCKIQGGTVFNMWFDCLISYGLGEASEGPDGEKIGEVLFDVLKSVLSMPHHTCRLSALRGFDKCDFPEGHRVVAEFLEKNRGALEEDLVSEATSILAGKNWGTMRADG